MLCSPSGNRQKGLGGKALDKTSHVRLKRKEKVGDEGYTSSSKWFYIALETLELAVRNLHSIYLCAADILPSSCKPDALMGVSQHPIR